MGLNSVVGFFTWCRHPKYWYRLAILAGLYPDSDPGGAIGGWVASSVSRDVIIYLLLSLSAPRRPRPVERVKTMDSLC